MKLMRVAVVCDFREENWPSMDLIADMLLSNLKRDYSDRIDATRIGPTMRQRFSSRGQSSGARGQHSEIDKKQQVHEAASLNGRRFNVDRVMNRFWDYPRFVRRLASQFDLFHLVDHSYGQLLHELPAERTVVTCHDLDTFQCVLNPHVEPRSLAFRKMMERTLSGFQRAARVACVSNATRNELLAHNLFEPDRLVVIPNGVQPAFSPEPNPQADEFANDLLGPRDTVDILHVGSTIPRKRIDLLLRIFAAVHEQVPQARLVRVGGPFTSEQRSLVNRLEIADAIVTLPRIDNEVLAAVYRRAAVLLQPSEREGFGLPVVEALACGTPVIASDLPALREVGGTSAAYCPVGDVDAWTRAIVAIVSNKSSQDLREAGLTQAAKFTWSEHARKTVALYQELL